MQRRSGGGSVKAVVLKSFSGILHLAQGDVVESTGAGPSGGDRCGRQSVAAVDGCSVD